MVGCTETSLQKLVFVGLPIAVDQFARKGMAVIVHSVRIGPSDQSYCASSDLKIIVAVGTTITDRPPHRSVLARLRIRLLRRMSGGEASIGIGVQNAGWRNPPVQDWGKTCPPQLCELAAADQNTLP
jgi:hypothetical protein